MIPMRDLDDDYYDFDEKNYCLIGRRHHHKYQLGDPIRIQVAKANLEKKQLDFIIADSTQANASKGDEPTLQSRRAGGRGKRHAGKDKKKGGKKR